MVTKLLSELFADKDPLPNKYSVAMGELIRKAREEAGLNQAELGEKIYRRRLAVSEMENGKVEVSAWTLPLLAAALEKPITYFYPDWLLRDIKNEELSTLEQELLIHFRHIDGDDFKRLAVRMTKDLSEIDFAEILLKEVDFAKSEFEVRKDIKRMWGKTPH